MIATKVNTSGKRVVDDDRHDVNVFFEDRWRVHLKRRPSRQVRKRFDRVKIKRVHNIVVFATKLWTQWYLRKDAKLVIN